MDEMVYTDYGQFDLVWDPEGGFDGDYDRFFDGQINGLVGAADSGGVYINLAKRFGGSSVQIVLVDAAPPLASDEYGDVVEVSCTVADEETPEWMSWAGQTSGWLEGLAPGTYRLRVSAQGRDEVRQQEGSDDIVDRYLLEFWPSPWAEDSIIRVRSDDARYWHDEIGGRR